VSRLKGDVENVQPGNHPGWAEWTLPLQEFLKEPRDWAELEAWRRGQSPFVSGFRLRNMLAWLEDRHRARSDLRDGEIVWMMEVKTDAQG
jgi:hypothetical protein